MRKILIIIGALLVVVLLVLGACAPQLAPPGEEAAPPAGGAVQPEQESSGGVAQPETEQAGGEAQPEKEPAGEVAQPEGEAAGEVAPPQAPEAIGVDVELEVESTNPEGTRFVAPETGSYEIAIVTGAYCYLPEEDPNWSLYGGWRTAIGLYINREVEWGEPDEWGLHPINPDHIIGPKQSYPTIPEAEAAAQGSSITVNLDKDDYIIIGVSDGSDWYHDNTGTVKIRITGP